jgi:hypothetical protein
MKKTPDSLLSGRSCDPSRPSSHILPVQQEIRKTKSAVLDMLDDGLTRMQLAEQIGKKFDDLGALADRALTNIRSVEGANGSTHALSPETMLMLKIKDKLDYSGRGEKKFNADFLTEDLLKNIAKMGMECDWSHLCPGPADIVFVGMLLAARGKGKKTMSLEEISEQTGYGRATLIFALSNLRKQGLRDSSLEIVETPPKSGFYEIKDKAVKSAKPN